MPPRKMNGDCGRDDRRDGGRDRHTNQVACARDGVKRRVTMPMSTTLQRLEQRRVRRSVGTRRNDAMMPTGFVVMLVARL